MLFAQAGVKAAHLASTVPERTPPPPPGNRDHGVHARVQRRDRCKGLLDHPVKDHAMFGSITDRRQRMHDITER